MKISKKIYFLGISKKYFNLKLRNYSELLKNSKIYTKILKKYMKNSR